MSLLAFYLFFVTVESVWAFRSEPELKQIYSDPNLQEEFKKLVRWSVKESFLKNSAREPELSEFFRRRAALFITFKKGSQVRACMGALKPQQASIKKEIPYFIQLALFHDPWHRRVDFSELSAMEVYISFVGKPVPIKNITELYPAKDGAYIKQGARGAVVLPGEAKTQRYLLALLKSKAGIDKARPYQLFKVPSISLGVKIGQISSK